MTELTSHIALQPLTENHTTICHDHEVSPTTINLGDPLKSVKLRSTYQWKYTLCIVFAVINWFVCYPGFYTSNYNLSIGVISGMKWGFLVYFSVLLLLCIVLCVHVLIKSSASQQPWISTLNRVINIQKPTTIYDLGVTEYVPVLIFVAIVWCCVENIVMLSAYEIHMRHSDVCGNHGGNDESPPQCFAAEGFGGGCLIVTSFSIFCLLQTIECKAKIQEEREKIKAKYAHISEIVERINDRLDGEWRDSMKLSNRLFEIFCVCAGCATFFVYEFTMSRQNIWHGGYPADVLFIGCMYHLGEIVVASAFLLLFQTITYHYYDIFRCIMDELAAPINAQSPQDIVGWWELRKYYIHCVVSVYLPSYRLLMIGASTGTIMGAIFYFFDTMKVELSIAVIGYCLTLVFTLTTQAVSYHAAQLSHLSTINKERLQFKMNGLNGYGNDINERRVDEIMDLLVIDIKSNTHPISALGVRLDANFMLFLRASVLTLSFALIFNSS
eukprot:6352_1